MRRSVLRKTLKLHPELYGGAYSWSPWCACELCIDHDDPDVPEDDPELRLIRKAVARVQMDLTDRDVAPLHLHWNGTGFEECRKDCPDWPDRVGL